MKNILFVFVLFFGIQFYSQEGGYTFFESGTLENWTNSDGSITNLTIEQLGSEEDEYYLKKQCDGSNTISGEMAIINNLYFQDNYMNGGAAIIYMKIKNENTFDLNLRLGFTDLDGSKIVMTTPIVIAPSIGIWQEIDFETLSSQDFTLIDGPNSITDILFGTFEMKLIHNENILFDGAYENGNLEVDNIGTVYLAGVNEFNKTSVKLYPNPTNGSFSISSNSQISKIEVYNNLGQLLTSNTNQNYIDISDLSLGLYFIHITDINGQSIVKKVVKE